MRQTHWNALCTVIGYPCWLALPFQPHKNVRHLTFSHILIPPPIHFVICSLRTLMSSLWVHDKSHDKPQMATRHQTCYMSTGTSSNFHLKVWGFHLANLTKMLKKRSHLQCAKMRQIWQFFTEGNILKIIMIYELAIWAQYYIPSSHIQCINIVFTELLDVERFKFTLLQYFKLYYQTEQSIKKDNQFT